ncbi:MAG TPA: porin [Methylibium sp.]|nr:porin [Methylibium sp.]
MKMTPLAVAVALAAAGAAQAQSSVTLYGIADAGISHIRGLNSAKTQLVSGIMEGSRFGFRGNEDLGGGYRTIFTLENRLELDTGALGNRPASGSQLPARFSSATALGLPAPLQPAVTQVAAGIGAQLGVNHIANNLFDRQAWVGLVTPVGAVLMGRQYTPAYEVSATFDTLYTASSLAFGQIAAIPPSVDIRVSNSVAYRIQTGPWSAAAMYGLGEGSATTGRLIGINAIYKVDAFSLGIAYQERDNENGQKSLTNFIVGGSAALGPGKLSIEYVRAKDDNPSGLTPVIAQLTPAIGPVFAASVVNAFRAALRQDANAFHIGYRYETGPHAVSVVYNRFDDRNDLDADVQSYGAVYSYAFSKRTDVSVVLAKFNNSETAQAAGGGQGYLGGVTSSPGRDFENVAVGIRHRF